MILSDQKHASTLHASAVQTLLVRAARTTLGLDAQYYQMRVVLTGTKINAELLL